MYKVCWLTVYIYAYTVDPREHTGTEWMLLTNTAVRRYYEYNDTSRSSGTTMHVQTPIDPLLLFNSVVFNYETLLIDRLNLTVVDLEYLFWIRYDWQFYGFLTHELETETLLLYPISLNIVQMHHKTNFQKNTINSTPMMVSVSACFLSKASNRNFLACGHTTLVQERTNIASYAHANTHASITSIHADCNRDTLSPNRCALFANVCVLALTSAAAGWHQGF